MTEKMLKTISFLLAFFLPLLASEENYYKDNYYGDKKPTDPPEDYDEKGVKNIYSGYVAPEPYEDNEALYLKLIEKEQKSKSRQYSEDLTDWEKLNHAPNEKRSDNKKNYKWPNRSVRKCSSEGHTKCDKFANFKRKMQEAFDIKKRQYA